MTIETPQDYLKRMIRQLGKQGDNATIAAMCNDKFKTQVTPERVQELRGEVER